MQPTTERGAQRRIKAGQHPAAVIEIDGGNRELSVLRQEAAFLVIDIPGNIKLERTLTLQRALIVVQARSAHTQLTVLAVDQAIRSVLHHASGGQGQQVIGSDRATIAVVQAPRKQGQQSLTGKLAALVIDLSGAQSQRPRAGQFALGVGQRTEQGQGNAGIADQSAGGIVERSAADIQGLGCTD
ncbi:hypothetical protein D3C77_158610 [compost metagenome]